MVLWSSLPFLSFLPLHSPVSNFSLLLIPLTNPTSILLLCSLALIFLICKRSFCLYFFVFGFATKVYRSELHLHGVLFFWSLFELLAFAYPHAHYFFLSHPEHSGDDRRKKRHKKEKQVGKRDTPGFLSPPFIFSHYYLFALAYLACFACLFWLRLRSNESYFLDHLPIFFLHLNFRLDLDALG